MIATAQEAKLYWSTQHSQSARVMPRGEGQDHRYEIAEFIAEKNPSSILEFGCSSGRNLAILRTLLPSTPLFGFDINEMALQAGKNSHPSLNLMLGDETSLHDLPDNSIDLAFTVSVLDHIPHRAWTRVYDDLVRVAKRWVVMLEPCLHNNGEWLEADFSDSSLGINAAPFSFAHDYVGHDPNVEMVRPLPILNAGQWEKFGSLYWLMQRAV